MPFDKLLVKNFQQNKYKRGSYTAMVKPFTCSLKIFEVLTSFSIPDKNKTHSNLYVTKYVRDS